MTTTEKQDSVSQFIADLQAVRQFHTKSGMSGSEIARRFGLHRNTVNQWISDVCRPHALVVQSLRPILDEIMKEQGLK